MDKGLTLFRDNGLMHAKNCPFSHPVEAAFCLLRRIVSILFVSGADLIGTTADFPKHELQKGRRIFLLPSVKLQSVTKLSAFS